MIRIFVACMLPLVLLGCATVDAERAPLVNAASADPIRTRTSFADALRCLDRQVRRTPIRIVPPTTFWVSDVRDETGTVATGARAMTEAAILQSARTSQRFSVRKLYLSRKEGLGSVTPFDVPQNVVVNANQLVDYVIEGTVSSFDRSVQEGQVGAGVSVSDAFDLSGSARDITNILSLDLTLFDPRTRLAKAHSSNSIVLSYANRGANVGGEIGKFGASFNFNLARANGTGQAVRTLIELGVIELIGEELRLPYWECLSIPSTNPEVTYRIYDWWDAMSASQQRAYLSTRLEALGYLPPGAGPEAFREALSRFQADAGLVATGRPSVESYTALLHETLRPKARLAAATPPPEAPAPGRSTQAEPNIALAAGYAPETGYRIALSLDRGSYVTCYLRLADGSFVRLLPNPFDSQPFYREGDHLIPSDRALRDVQIRPGEGSVEMVAICYATGQEVMARLPAALREPAFKVMPGVTDRTIGQAFDTVEAGFVRGAYTKLPRP